MSKSANINASYDPISYKIGEAKEAIRIALRAGQQPMVWGSYGIGKSTIVRDIAKEEGYDSAIIITPSQDDIIDYKLPYIKESDKRVEETIPMSSFAYSSRLPRNGRHLVFVDEINTASLSLQPTLFSFILEGVIGEYKLPDGCGRIGAGNREGDKCAAQPMAAALKDRLCPHINLMPDAKSWCEYAGDKNLRPELVAFVQDNPQVVEGADPEDPSGGCTPRSLEKLSHLLNVGINAKIEDRMIRGTIGQACGAMLAGYLDIFRSKIDINKLITDPKNYPLPKRSDIAYCLSASLSYRMADLSFDKQNKKRDNQTLKSILTYLERMEPTYIVMATIDAGRRNPLMRSQPAFADFCLKYHEIAIVS